VRNSIVIGASIPIVTTVQYAIEISSGTGIRVSDNTVVNPFVPGVGETGGIRVSNAVAAVIERNTVSSNVVPPPVAWLLVAQFLLTRASSPSCRISPRVCD
jgi:hypothetical protein